MNWGRGFFRLWLVVSAFWIVIWGRMAYDDEIQCFVWSNCARLINQSDHFGDIIVFGPPLASLALSFMVA